MRRASRVDSNLPHDITVEQYRSTAKKPHKYGVAPVADRTYNGVVYHSKREAQFAWELDQRVKAGEFVSVDRQAHYPIFVNGQRICDTVLDFRVVTPDHKMVIFEVKGYGTEIWKLKKKLLLACYPGIDLRIVK